MKKIKDFLMAISANITLFSVGTGLGILFGKILNYILSFFPESFQLPVTIGMFFVCIGLLTSVLINLKKKDE